MNPWRKRWAQALQYGAAWQNYLLLARALYAAWLVRRQLPSRCESPLLAQAIAAVAPLYLPPQSGWHGVDAATILRFAGFVVGGPLTWGRCVQKSLIAYRLLNGYGIPARLCFGIHRDDQTLDGHAWVEQLSEPKRALGESRDPYLRYLPVYTSPQPAPAENPHR